MSEPRRVISRWSAKFLSDWRVRTVACIYAGYLFVWKPWLNVGLSHPRTCLDTYRKYETALKLLHGSSSIELLEKILMVHCGGVRDGDIVKVDVGALTEAAEEFQKLMEKRQFSDPRNCLRLHRQYRLTLGSPASGNRSEKLEKQLMEYCEGVRDGDVVRVDLQALAKAAEKFDELDRKQRSIF